MIFIITRHGDDRVGVGDSFRFQYLFIGKVAADDAGFVEFIFHIEAFLPIGRDDFYLKSAGFQIVRQIIGAALRAENHHILYFFLEQTVAAKKVAQLEMFGADT